MAPSTSWLPATYFPKHTQNRMASEGDLVRARADFVSRKSNNLEFLLRNRYAWMNDYIEKEHTVIEIGAGAGLSKSFIKRSTVITTEISHYPWVDICVDALNLPFHSDSIDVFICINVLHHLTTPIRFLRDVYRCLKGGGHLLLLEPNPSLLLLIALRIMRHEGWSFELNVFDPAVCVNDPADPWSGNNAISYLLFADKSAFEKNAPGFEIMHDAFSECIMFPLSGGVTAKIRTVELPVRLLKIIDRIDHRLCRLAPMIFAMARSLVLRKRPNDQERERRTRQLPVLESGKGLAVMETGSGNRQSASA